MVLVVVIIKIVIITVTSSVQEMLMTYLSNLLLIILLSSGDPHRLLHPTTQVPGAVRLPLDVPDHVLKDVVLEGVLEVMLVHQSLVHCPLLPS